MNIPDSFIVSPIEVVAKCFEDHGVSLTPANIQKYLEPWQIDYIMEYAIEYNLTHIIDLEHGHKQFKKAKKQLGMYWDKKENKRVKLHINEVADNSNRYIQVLRWKKMQQCKTEESNLKTK